MKKTLLFISLIFLIGCASNSKLDSALNQISIMELQISQKDADIEELEDQIQSLKNSLESLQNNFDELSEEHNTLSDLVEIIEPTSSSVVSVQPTVTSMPEPTNTPTEVLSYLVVNVIDGDTIEISTGERVRLLGIDTPEVGECGEFEATQYLSNRILGKNVFLISDPLADDKDRYGRLLRYIEINGIDLNLELVKDGYADSYVYHDLTGYPYSREASYHSSQGELITCNIPTSTPYLMDPTTTYTNPCSGQVFSVCADMKAAGCAPAIQGRDDWYRPARDGDNDGIACE